VVLPFGKSLSIAAKSLRARFFRSLVTAAGLVLAVAFLAHVLVSTALANALLSTGDPALRAKVIAQGHELAPDAASVSTDPKTRWLAVLSLLVCAAGIMNAQLMAVTERFREIGTMKCLGALDRFILRLFLLEAAMLGLAGSVAGAFAGAASSLVQARLQLGPASLACVRPLDILFAMGAAAFAGFVLSLLGVLYPAFAAARMRPVDAMRSEI
jgi:hypothetical protein